MDFRAFDVFVIFFKIMSKRNRGKDLFGGEMTEFWGEIFSIKAHPDAFNLCRSMLLIVLQSPVKTNILRFFLGGGYSFVAFPRSFRNFHWNPCETDLEKVSYFKVILLLSI